MATPVWHDLGPVDGACTVCAGEGGLSLGEARFTRSALERLRREAAPSPSRFVTCGDCGWRWPVRRTDTTAAGIGRRPPGSAPAAPVTATRTVLPEPRSGRDWAYDRR